MYVGKKYMYALDCCMYVIYESKQCVCAGANANKCNAYMHVCIMYARNDTCIHTCITYICP